MIAAWAAAACLIGWWAATVVVLALTHAPGERKRAVIFGLGTAALVVGLVLVRLFADRPDALGVAGAFGGVFLVWAWIEVSFYTGYVTGPSKEPPPGGVGTFRLLGHALGNSLYHEVALLALAGAVWLAVPPGASTSAWWAFVILAGMHTSARLNVLLGVRNLNLHLLPSHLDYLRPYFRRRKGNWLMPVSLVLGTALAVGLGWSAWTMPPSAERIELILLTALAAIGVVEHVLLVLPAPVERLWDVAGVRRLPGSGPTAPGSVARSGG